MTTIVDELLTHDQVALNLQVDPDELRTWAADPTWGPVRIMSASGDMATFMSAFEAWGETLPQVKTVG